MRSLPYVRNEARAVCAIAKANDRSGSEARIRRSLKRTLGVTDPRSTGQEPIADVFAVLGVRPLWPIMQSIRLWKADRRNVQKRQNE